LNDKNAKITLRNGLMVSALFGLILLSVIPTMFSSSSTKIVQRAAGQPEDPFPVISNEILTPAQRAAREQLLK
jgi:hypothetical protein